MGRDVSVDRSANVDCGKGWDCINIRGNGPCAIEQHAKTVTTEQCHKAIEFFNEAIKIDGNCGDAWRGKSMAYLFLNQFDDVLTCCDEAIRINANDADAFNLKGVAFQKKSIPTGVGML